MSARTAAPRNHPLDLEVTLRLLRKQGLLTAAQCARIRTALRSDDERHPLTRIAELGMRGGADERESLTPETLTRALASATGLAYFRIDPLKINVEAVTALVSQAYATRFGFLPVAVHDDEVVIASAEPFVTTWHEELERVLKRPIRHVLANPHDIQRYLREFYGVSRSISGATHKTADSGSKITNFEQLHRPGHGG